MVFAIRGSGAADATRATRARRGWWILRLRGPCALFPKKGELPEGRGGGGTARYLPLLSASFSNVHAPHAHIDGDVQRRVYPAWQAQHAPHGREKALLAL